MINSDRYVTQSDPPPDPPRDLEAPELLPGRRDAPAEPAGGEPARAPARAGPGHRAPGAGGPAGRADQGWGLAARARRSGPRSPGRSGGQRSRAPRRGSGEG